MWIFSQLPLPHVEACVGFPQPLSLPSVQGMCALALAHWACPLYAWDLLHLFRLPRPASCPWGLCSHVSVLWNCPLHCKFCVCSEFHVPDIPSGTLAGPSCLWGFCGLLLFLGLLYSLGPQSMSCYGLKCSFLCFCPRDPLFCPRFHNSLLGPTVRSFPVFGNLFLLHDSFPWGPNSHLEVLHLFAFMSPSSLLHHSRSLVCPDSEAWGHLLSPRGCFVGVVLR